MKISNKLHLWLSVPFGIFITLICFSGACLIFENEITRALYPEVQYVTPLSSGTLPANQLADKVSSQLEDGQEITQVTIYPEANRAWRMSLNKPRRAAVYVNPYTGEITGEYRRLPFFATMLKIHRCMLDPAGAHGDKFLIGKNIVGASTIVLVIALITGLIMWWPKLRRNARRSLSIPLRRGGFTFLRGLHDAGGTYALIMVAAMALTGLTWSYKWYRSAFYNVAGTGVPETTSMSGVQRDFEVDSLASRAQWQVVYDALAKANPTATAITLADNDATVAFGDYGNIRRSDFYTFDRYGKTKLVESYTDKSPALRLRGWVYSVHIGAFGGLTTRIIWALAALIGATLPLTGYYLWIRRLRRRRK